MANKLLFCPTNVQVARKNYLDAKRDYEKALFDFGSILTGINTGLIHGRKEQSLINKIRPTIDYLTALNLKMVKCEWLLNQAVKKWKE